MIYRTIRILVTLAAARFGARSSPTEPMRTRVRVWPGDADLKNAHQDSIAFPFELCSPTIGGDRTMWFTETCVVLVVAGALFLPACVSAPEPAPHAERCVALRSFTTATPGCPGHHGSSGSRFETTAALAEIVRGRLTEELERRDALSEREGCAELSGQVEDATACVEERLLNKLQKQGVELDRMRVCVEIDARVEDDRGTRSHPAMACAEFARVDDEQENVRRRNDSLASAADAAAVVLVNLLGS